MEFQTINGKIKRVFVPPVPYDGGLSSDLPRDARAGQDRRRGDDDFKGCGAKAGRQSRRRTARSEMVIK